MICCIEEFNHGRLKLWADEIGFLPKFHTFCFTSAKYIFDSMVKSNVMAAQRAKNPAIELELHQVKFSK